MIISKEQQSWSPETFQEARRIIKRAKRITVWVSGSPSVTVPTTKQALLRHVFITEDVYNDMTKLVPLSLYLPETDNILHVGE